MKEEQQVDANNQPDVNVRHQEPLTEDICFPIHPDVNINDYPGGYEGMSYRPGVVFNSGGASRIGQYANFTDGEHGFQIACEDSSDNNYWISSNRRCDHNNWNNRFKIYHTGHLKNPFGEVDKMLVNQHQNGTWDEGIPAHRYRVASFANAETGFQFLATTKNENWSDPTKTEIFVRVKKNANDGYGNSCELYHTGNFNPADYLKSVDLSKKADKTYVDSQDALKANNSDINSIRKEITSLNTALDKKADKDAVSGYYAVGKVVGQGVVDCSGGGHSVYCRCTDGYYEITFAPVLPPRYGVLITLHKNDPSKFSYGVSSIQENGFKVNILKDGKSTSSEFFFQIFKY